MGQKTHPLGFRIGITQDIQSKWFANFKNYSNLIEEDNNIRTFLRKNEKKAGIGQIQITRLGLNKIEIKINCAKPGSLVGIDGQNLTIIHKKLNKITQPNTKVLLQIIEFFLQLINVLFPLRF